jgi:hypothetical protein
MRVSLYKTLAIPAALLLGAGLSSAQQAQTHERSGASATQSSTRSDDDVTYGRVKEYTAGQKIVIDVDNAPDKSFDLSDRKNRFNLSSGLKVGDPVKITEHDVAGTKDIDIAKDTTSAAKHGDKTKAEERASAQSSASGSADRAADADRKAKPDVTYGKIKELNAGQKVVVAVDNAPDKSYDLKDKDVAVNLGSGLAVGDQVKVTERESAGKKHVEITKGTPSSADRKQ